MRPEDIIKEEITSDPERLGYAGKTDKEVVAILNDKKRSRQKEALFAADIFELIDTANLRGLSASDTATLSLLLSIQGEIKVGPDSKGRALLFALFPRPSATRTALMTAFAETVSRAEELGLKPVTVGLLQGARRLMNA